ncbi:hypothetical protein AKJ44_03020 [candidate division MSBL1 archaeon SCGC-AAA261F17]|uniref:Hydrogenase maturation factor HypA n=1 Tax=candidate division MSBL1 archaeon SCGC-AAA261F17 TaxID=1698274 RepID=A0A133V3Q0_9EURY|nr:hypothetical protein AKJ44_03020 [candidate division MSBL1 archaeon SCGC-AAA261F17]
MHEWALAEGVVSTALKIADERNARKILEIRIKVGKLQQIDSEIFEFALKELAKNTKAEESKIRLEPEEVVLICNLCNHEWSFDEVSERLSPEESELIHFFPEVVHTYARCPECGSPDFRIEGGRGAWIDSIEMEA